MRTVYINGKFTAQPTTGVQRVSASLIQAMDDHLLNFGGAAHTRWVLLCPANGAAPALKQIEVRHVGWRLPSLHLWEQVALPLAARGGLLLNLSGSAPALKRSQVCTFHDAAVFDRPEAYTAAFVAWYRFLFRRLSRAARLVITVSEFSKQRLTAHLGLPAERIAVVRSGAEHLLPVTEDASILARLGLVGEPYFLAVGSSNPIKNHAALVEAFSALREGCAARLVIVGGVHGAVFAGAPPTQVGHRILRAGAVNDAQLKALYRHAQGLLFPSTYEGYGLPPLEAMSFGCPVIASRAAAIPEVCGDAALYVDPHSVTDMTAAIERLIGDPSLCERLRRSGAERIKLLTWPNAARALFAHLHAAGLTEAAAL